MEIIQIPTMDISFMDDIMKSGIADSSIDVKDDVYYSYENNGNEHESSEQRLTKFGFDVKKIKEWNFN